MIDIATYQQILDAENAIDSARTTYEFRRAISNVLAAAEDNAQDDTGRIDSIVSLLSFPDRDRPSAVVAWFAALGITA